MATGIVDIMSLCPNLRGPVQWGEDSKCLQTGVYLVVMPYPALQATLDCGALNQGRKGAFSGIYQLAGELSPPGTGAVRCCR